MSKNRVRNFVQKNNPVYFYFDGIKLSGFYGESLASALLANGIKLVGRSFKYHRPRGIMALGTEEPNALVSIINGNEINMCFRDNYFGAFFIEYVISAIFFE